MLFSATVLMLFGAALAQQQEDTPSGQLPIFVNNFLSNLNKGNRGQTVLSQQPQGFVPPNLGNADQQISNSPPASIPLSTSSLPNVYGPLAANWSACPAGFDCCNGGYVYADPYNAYECCGESAYDRRYQRCELGQVIPLTANGPTGSITQRLIRINCGGYLYVANEMYRCCNFDVYDPLSQQCKDGQIIPIPAPAQPSLPYGSVYAVCGNYRYVLASGATFTWGCCGQDLYNYNTENCTTQGIVPLRTPEIQSQVPAAQGLLVFCSGVRYWVDPNALSTIRCCGSRLCSAMYQPAMLPQTAPSIGGIGQFSISGGH